jgi:hypothetical protein
MKGNGTSRCGVMVGMYPRTSLRTNLGRREQPNAHSHAIGAGLILGDLARSQKHSCFPIFAGAVDQKMTSGQVIRPELESLSATLSIEPYADARLICIPPPAPLIEITHALADRSFALWTTKRLADFLHRDFIFKVVRIERIDPSFRGFSLRIHEVRQRFAG